MSKQPPGRPPIPPAPPSPGGPARPPDRVGGPDRRPLLALGVVLVLAAGGIAFTAVRTSGDEPEEPAPTVAGAEDDSLPSPVETLTPGPSDSKEMAATRSGPFPDRAETRLLSHLPREFAGTCRRLAVDLPEEATAAITCTPHGVDFVRYLQYKRTNSMNRHYAGTIEARGVIRNSGSAGCRDGLPSEGVYTRAKKTPGRLMCYFNGDQARMDWTHESLSIYASASRADGKLRKLFRFWTDAGPFGRPVPLD